MPSASSATAWTPEFSVETRYDDNVLRRSDRLEDLVTVFSPGLRLLRDGGTNWCELRGSRSFVSYARDPSPTILTDRALARAVYVPARDQSLAFQYRYNRTRDPIDFEEESDEVISRGNVSRLRGDIVAETWRGELVARTRDWWYRDQDLADGRARNAALRLFPLRTRTTLGLVGYRMRHLDSDSSGFQSNIGVVGVRRWHSDRTVSEFEVGVADTRFDDHRSSEQDLAVAFGIGRARQLGTETWAGRVRIGRDVASMAMAEVEALWPSKRAVARVESVVDAEGGYFREPTRVRRAAVEFRGIYDQMYRLSVAGSFGRHEKFRGAGRRADLWRLSTGVSLQMRSWLYARTAYSFYREELPDPADGRNIHRNRVTLSLNAGAPLADGHPMPGDPFGSWRPPLWSTQ